MAMEEVVSIGSFIALCIILTILVFMFVKLVDMSVKLNDLNYYVKRHQIPFKENRFDYLINESPTKNLL